MIGMLLLLLSTAPVATAPLPDVVLAEQRGGFQLPNGIDVALTVQTQTTVDGAVVLRTVFKADQGAPSLTIFVPKAGAVVAANGSDQAQGTRSIATPTVSYDRARGIEVTPGNTGPSLSLSAVRTGAAAGVESGPIPAGLEAVASGAVTQAGTVTESAANNVRAVSLQGADLNVTHLAGNAFGSAIANSGNDRAIDTQTIVSIELGNVGPDVLGSAIFRVQDIALDTASMRVK